MPESDENSSVQYETSCSDNTEYGLEVAERFLNKRHTSVGRDLRHELTQHNYRAAKQVCVDHGKQLVGQDVLFAFIIFDNLILLVSQNNEGN